MVNKDFCASSFLLYRFIVDDNLEFYEHTKHTVYPLGKIIDRVSSAKEIENSIINQLNELKGKKIAIMLSGGIDSAILASYLPGCDAYTFRYLNGTFQEGELERAKYYADKYNLNLHYIDINFERVDVVLDEIMLHKGAPVHSIEPQIYLAAKQAKMDGNEIIIVGESADILFGGLDSLLSKDWEYNEFIKRFIYTNPKDVLTNPIEIYEPFEKFKIGNKIDFIKFIQTVYLKESISSYYNAIECAGMECCAPYYHMRINGKLDLVKIRNGNSKYLLRELFSKRYPNYPIPNKLPMPRPVDEYFKSWQGPQRKEFLKDLDISKFSGNSKWQIYCLERFLNICEKYKAY